MTKGFYGYICKDLKEELDNTMKFYKLNKLSDAQRKLIEDLRIGRELRFALGRKK
jgi:hypothetical protein